MSITIYSSPLQGFTDFRFRLAFQKYFGGVDVFYAPYIRLKQKQEIKASYQRDLNPQNNEGVPLIPQVMCNSAEDFLFVAQYVQGLGYKELNWNLGCPYPMVTTRGLGSGLIKDYQKVDEILNQVEAESDIEVSIKMRLGLECKEEIFKFLPMIEKHSIKNLAIHPRLGKQLYKGSLDLETFEECTKRTSHDLHYNGNITNVGVFRILQDRFPSIQTWLLGRGIIANPYLAQMIKSDLEEYPEDHLEKFTLFHADLLEAYSIQLSGDKHILMKMYSFWEYFIQTFSSSPKGLKRIKKAKNVNTYKLIVDEIIQNER